MSEPDPQFSPPYQPEPAFELQAPPPGHELEPPPEQPPQEVQVVERVVEVPSKRGFSWGCFFMTIVLLGIISVPVVVFLQTTGMITGFFGGIGRFFSDTAESFSDEKITSTFTESISQIEGTNGDILELATFETNAQFTDRNSRSMFWGLLPLGETIVSIRAPVTYRYHLKLSDTWKLTTRDNTCLVMAPQIRPSLPPAIHTDRMEKLAVEGWSRFNGDELLAKLEKGITPELVERAGSEENLKSVREHARHSVGEFVKNWLMTEDQWREDRFTTVVVYFPEEVSLELQQDLGGTPEEEPARAAVPE